MNTDKNGDGTLQPTVTYSMKLAYSLAVADFNGDGNLEVWSPIRIRILAR